MNFNFVNLTENKNLIPLELKSKKDYFLDLTELENSFVSRMDIFKIANTFFMESVQLIVNAITLFEKGYLDNAYYSLRQALETALTLVYLSDIDDESRASKLKEWKKKSRFPMYSKMLELLNKNEAIFFDLKKNMPDFFDEVKLTKEKINKHVHKQGFDTFYVSRSHVFSKDTDQEKTIEEFELCLNQCISALVIFRLCLDPLPVLLADNEIYNRTEQFMADPFTNDFIEKYMGDENLKNYKKTIMYESAYEYFIGQEQFLPGIFQIKKYRFVDRDKADDIVIQKHLLSDLEKQAVQLMMTSDKITRITLAEFQLEWFFSNTKSVRGPLGFPKEINFEWMNRTIENFPIDNALVSSVVFEETTFLLEHNEILSKSEIRKLKNL